MRTPSYSSFDEALEVLAPYGMELKNGNSNHAPMVAEALCAMGRPDAVLPWVARYRDRMLPRPSPRQNLPAADWRSALGRRDRFADWAALIATELQEASWPEVLDRWVARLAPGFSAAATHGAIRVGHAARSLAAAETPLRVRELADALASWAATYQELPAGRKTTDNAAPPREAINKVPVIPPGRRACGNITASLAVLYDFAEFAPVIGMIEVSGDIGALICEVSEVFARLYLAQAHNIQTTIVFIHGVTSLAALGHIITNIGENAARSALCYAWQSGCGLYSCFGIGGPALAVDIEPCEEDADRLFDLALANGDEHVIKFAEACLGRHAARPSPAYPAAIAKALATVPHR